MSVMGGLKRWVGHGGLSGYAEKYEESARMWEESRVGGQEYLRQRKRCDNGAELGGTRWAVKHGCTCWPKS